MEKKSKGGAEKNLKKKKQALEADVAKCAKLTDTSAAAGPSSAALADEVRKLEWE